MSLECVTSAAVLDATDQGKIVPRECALNRITVTTINCCRHAQCMFRKVLRWIRGTESSPDVIRYSHPD